MKWRPDVEGLRGVAVLLVVAYHVAPAALPGGFVGVDVFFVLSGYLITRLLAGELEVAHRIRLAAFYARRVRRLLPAAALTLVVSLGASLLLLTPLRVLDVAASAAAAAVYATNVHFAVASANYFAPDVHSNPLLHMWSLAVEEQFYLVWPLLLSMAWRAAGRRGLGIALAATVAGGLAVSACLVEAASEWAFYGTHSRAWQFAAGGLAGLLVVRGGTAAAAVGWAGMAAVLVSAFMLTDLFPFPGLAAVPVTLGTATVLVAAAEPGSLLHRALATRPLRELGRLSYGWYLWHWPALVLAEAALGPLATPERLAVAVGALVVAEASYRLVEHSVRHHKRLIAAPRLAFALMGALVVSTLGASGVAAAITHFRVGGELQRLVAAPRDYERPVVDGCLQRDGNTELPPCWYGAEDGGATLVLFGDSHASHWFPALELIAERNGWRLLVRVKNSCSVADIQIVVRGGPVGTDCGAWRKAVLEELAELRPDLVITSWSANRPELDADWADELAEGLTRLRSVARRVVYLRDLPVAPFDVPECLLRARRACSFDASAGLKGAAGEVAAATAAHVVLLDLTDVACPGGRCPAWSGGVVTRRDRSHMTASFAATLAPALEAVLERVAFDGLRGAR